MPYKAKNKLTAPAAPAVTLADIKPLRAVRPRLKAPEFFINPNAVLAEVEKECASEFSGKLSKAEKRALALRIAIMESLSGRPYNGSPFPGALNCGLGNFMELYLTGKKSVKWTVNPEGTRDYQVKVDGKWYSMEVKTNDGPAKTAFHYAELSEADNKPRFIVYVGAIENSNGLFFVPPVLLDCRDFCRLATECGGISYKQPTFKGNPEKKLAWIQAGSPKEIHFHLSRKLEKTLRDSGFTSFEPDKEYATDDIVRLDDIG